MRISAGFTIVYDCLQAVPMLLTLSVHPSLRGRLLTPEWIRTDPGVEVRQYLDGFGNICSRVLAPAGRFALSTGFDIADDGAVDVFAPGAVQVDPEDLPDAALVYLLGSRYCETDQLMQTAWSLFGDTPPGWARVQAVTDFVHRHIRFGYEHARATRSAWEAYQEGVGVCRDYAHLAIALCRCLNIPARYCTGYLGEIGVPPVGVTDFCAWFEVWLDDRWYVFDARNNRPRIGRLLMARGRDATDVAMVNTFGPAVLVEFTVVTVEGPVPALTEGLAP